MAGFEGIVWAHGQLAWSLADRSPRLLPPDAGTPAVSKSIHYGLFLAFEGIRFFARPGPKGPEVVFLNLDRNLARFREAIAWCLSTAQQPLVPSEGELRDVFLAYLGHPDLRPFVDRMVREGAQGYLRPFTVDDHWSIGVTFPTNPSIRVVAARYDRYMGEPFHGVVVPWLVRAVGANGTGRLKLGGNYLLSVKAIDAAKRIRPDASTALFLDDQLHRPLFERQVTEWDTSCALVALRDGRVIRIPDGPLILPSVTIRGITAVLREQGVPVEERPLPYGELVEWAARGEVVTVCSVGTAGILNRCASLALLNEQREELGQVRADPGHPSWDALARARATYWDVYRGLAPVPEGLRLDVFAL